MAILVGGEPRSMNCALGVAFDQVVSTAFVERLVPTDDDFAPTQGGLVASWEQIADTTWRLKVREGVEFSNGERWDAEALKFSLETMRETEGIAAAFFTAFDDFRVIDPYTLDATTTVHTSAVPALLSFGCAFPPEYYKEVGADGFGRKPIGTGPYVLDEWLSGEQVRASANSKYWRGSPKLSSVVWKFVPNQTTRLNLLISGGGDLALDIPVDRIADVEDSGLKVHAARTGNLQQIGMNKEEPPLDSLELRQAVAMAIDRDAIVEHIFRGDGVGAVATDQFFPSVYNAVADVEADYDPDRARELVSAAGGARLPFHYTVGRYPKDQEVGEAIAGMLTNVGFEVEMLPMDGSEFFAKKLEPGFSGLWSSGTPAVIPHPDVLVGALLGSSPARDYCTGADYDNWRSAGLEASDERERSAIYSRVAEEVLNEDVCFSSLYLANNIVGMVDGMTFRAGYDTLIDYTRLGWR